MTPGQLQVLKEKAELWDNLSPTLRGIYASQFKYGTSTIENISNASSHVGLLEEESKEMVNLSSDGIVEDNEDYFVNINGCTQTLNDYLSDIE